ncbi:helix-turn-helix domain-containing protein [Lactobacillus crispatus]|uniref:helix-turn-helix domain-containing protein n=1 Tax=Lactobacillus crispatus TaxID=47770 RepID=UPI0032B3770F
MEFRDLKYFQKLVETKNYNRTAEFFGVTQPAISSMVKRLEKENWYPTNFSGPQSQKNDYITRWLSCIP